MYKTLKNLKWGLDGFLSTLKIINNNINRNIFSPKFYVYIFAHPFVSHGSTEKCRVLTGASFKNYQI